MAANDSNDVGRTSFADNNPLNIDGPNFDSEAYMSKLLKERTLKELMGEENKMCTEVIQLDSEMQSLVYENYAKFITATDTVRQMKTDFSEMEVEMDRLAENMEKITQFSQKVCGSLQGRKNDIQQLVAANNTLKNLEYLLDLPSRMNDLIYEKKDYGGAVRTYLKLMPTLEERKSLPALQGIYGECAVLISELKDLLKDSFRSRSTTQSPKDMSIVFGYLIELGESRQGLSTDYISNAKQMLDEDLNELKLQARLKVGEFPSSDSIAKKPIHVPEPEEPRCSSSSATNVNRPSDAILSLPMDVLEFIDTASNGFLANLKIVVETYLEMFVTGSSPLLPNARKVPGTERVGSRVAPEFSHATAVQNIRSFMVSLVNEFLVIAEARLLAEDGTEDASLLIRSLDRFYRRLAALSKIIPSSLPQQAAAVPGKHSKKATTKEEMDFAEASIPVISKVANTQIDLSLERLKQSFASSLAETRQLLAAPRTLIQPLDAHNQPLAELISKMERSVVQKIKAAVSNLQPLLDQSIAFIHRPSFTGSFSVAVREGLVVGYFRYIIQLCTEITLGQGDKAYVTPTVVLLLARFCVDLKTSTVGYVLDLCDKQFFIATQSGDFRHTAASKLTPLTTLNSELSSTAQRLIDHYVELEGFSLSQMVSRSVETRDWIAAVEPRSVRAVMKRVVEDLSAIDGRVSQLLEEGTRKDRSSDCSSHRTGGIPGSISSRHASRPGGGGNQLTINFSGNSESSLLKKLWSEKIDYFASVELTKVSVLTGIIKLCLKTLLECVRLQTFGKYGLQQVQVDAHYLQLYLWRFVADENLVRHLLEEIMSSVALRCLEPTLMEPSVVETICERG